MCNADASMNRAFGSNGGGSEGDGGLRRCTALHRSLISMPELLEDPCDRDMECLEALWTVLRNPSGRREPLEPLERRHRPVLATLESSSSSLTLSEGKTRLQVFWLILSLPAHRFDREGYVTLNMSNVAPTAVRQAARLCSRRLPPSSLTRSSPRLRGAGSAATSTTARRNYVSETNPSKAQVNIDTTIKADHDAFISQTGTLPEHVKVPGTGLSADAMMSPAAGILKQATIMDEGTRPIYLDMQATTPTDPRVLDAMLPYFTGLYGNPHSRTHAYGWETEKATEQAREHIANLIGADSKEIIFTSGATESNNMSIKGVARFFGRSGKKKHIITSQTEHKCVLDSARHLQDEGFDVTYLPVQNNGLINMQELEAAIRPDTALVSIMTVNNEIGVIQPMEEIGKLCRSKKVFFHTDGAQAVGKMPIDVNKWNVDLMSISAHKIYGPKGIGACYVRRRPRVRLDPIISGGGQERGLRSGTLAPALVVGFGEACRIAKEEMAVSDPPTRRSLIRCRHEMIISAQRVIM